jgi:hypothetical protein
MVEGEQKLQLQGMMKVELKEGKQLKPTERYLVSGNSDEVSSEKLMLRRRVSTWDANC